MFGIVIVEFIMFENNNLVILSFNVIESKK